VDSSASPLRHADVLKRFSDQGLVSVGNFATSVLLARLLGPAQFGIFALLWTVVVFALSAQWALITSPMQSTLAQRAPGSRADLCGALWTHALAVGLLAGAGAVLMVRWVGGSGAPGLGGELGLVAAVACMVAQDFVRRWLLATERPGLALISDVLRQALVLGVLWLWARSGSPNVWLATQVIGAAAALGCLPLIADLRGARIGTMTAMAWARRHYASARWLMPSVVLQSISASAPLYLLGASLSLRDVGGYRAAVALASPIVIVTEALETFLPLRARQAMVAGGVGELGHKLRGWAAVLFPACAAYVAITYALGDTVVRATFGSSYASYVHPVLILAIANLLQFAVYILNVALRSLARAEAIFAGDVLATVVLMGSLLLVAPAATPWKAAVCVAVHQAVKLVALAAFVRKAQATITREL
jgi:O-antigen/teichoic acid export membrane protein